MTIKEALQAEVEYDNTNIIDKTLLDVLPSGTTGSIVYPTETHKDWVSEATAYVLRTAARAPEFREGSRFIGWKRGYLLREAKRILIALGIETDGISPGTRPSMKSGGYM